MSFNKYHKFCYKLLSGKIKDNKWILTDKLKKDLETANLGIRDEAYLACALMTSIISAFVGIFLVVLGILIPFFLGINLPSLLQFLIYSSPLLFPGIIHFYYMLKPSFRTRSRANKIELHMPYALNFIAAMSAAGITPSEIITSLSRQEIYGEVRNEALLMDRDMSILGKDIVSALRDAVERTPSKKFREFLQGTIITTTSGGSLKPYFMSKADQYMRENRQTQRKFSETLGAMAEAYVTAAVAGILMIMIIIPLMMMLSGSGEQIPILYVFVFLVIPLIHLGFAVTIKSMTPEV